MSDKNVTRSKEKRVHPGRAEALRLLAEMAEEFSELRIGQIIGNACGPDPYYTEDRDLIEHLRRARAIYREVGAGMTDKDIARTENHQMSHSMEDDIEQAADEIERLRARCEELGRANAGLVTESERLRAALEKTRTKTATAHNAWLDIVLGYRP
jgi:FtsZ-binding cell division protein ZapB